MKTLVVIPLSEEMTPFLELCTAHDVRFEAAMIGKLAVTRCPDLEITLACGGLGKTQFAIQVQHLLDFSPDFDLVICAGAAGALADSLSVGDVVVATETVEYDIYNGFGTPLIPRYAGHESTRDAFKEIPLGGNGFRVHFGPIASGDEDVMDTKRRKEIQKRTGGLAVAWEGAGGARACQFNGVPYLEIRGITDAAQGTALADFEKNLPTAMRNVAALILAWAGRQTNARQPAPR